MLKYKEAPYKRDKELFSRGTAVSEDDVESAESAYCAAKAPCGAANATLDAIKSQLETAKSALFAAQTLIDLANIDLGYTKITAPIDGKIGKVAVTKGNLVTPTLEKLVDIKQISPIYVCFAIGERLFRSTYGGVDKIKDIARIGLELPGGRMYTEEGRIALVDNKIDPKTNTVMIWGTLPNENRILLPGLCNVFLCSRSDSKARCLLLSAIQTDKNGTLSLSLARKTGWSAETSNLAPCPTGITKSCPA